MARSYTTVFTSRVPEVLRDVRRAQAKALEICGGKCESYAKANLTKNKSVITGNLRNSITHKQEDVTTEIIGTSVSYAPYVELGHHQQPGRYVPAIGKRLVRSYVPGKPYLRPALENHVAEYKNVIETELKKVK